MDNKISIVFTIDDSFAQHCCTTMVSVLENNSAYNIDFYILTDYFSDENRRMFQSALEKYGSGNSVEFKLVDHAIFEGFKLNIKYITFHTYYRFLIADLFPELTRVLYLDADLIVDGSITELWETPLEGYLCAGVSDLWVERTKYKYMIGLQESDIYINAGVILMNVEAMRKEHTTTLLMDVAKEPCDEFQYQDQDIINWALRGKIKGVSKIFNYTTDDVYYTKAEKPVIIHYTGRIKPWNINEKCRNPLRTLYFKYLAKTPYKGFIGIFKRGRLIRTIKKMCGINVKPRKIKVALVVDEYFGGMGTAFGGYGFLARYYIARYLPNEDISVEVLLAKNSNKWACRAKKGKVDGIKVIVPPGKKFVYNWMKKTDYDIYFTVEVTHDLLKYEHRGKPVIHWIQDPRPWTEWREIQTVKLFPEACYWSSDLYDIVHRFYTNGHLKFISQGHYLNEKAKMLYRLPEDAEVTYCPNPIDIDYRFDPDICEKKNHIIFVGRIESVKRGWLFCEIAKRMPQYEFFMLGQTFREKEENETVLSRYKTGIPNLHFVGHVEGEEKNKYIREAKILVNTSIHEGLPITFLEALAYGTLLVSCRNPDDLTSKFGEFVGTILGDGFDGVPKFVSAIEDIMSDEERRKKLSREAVSYIREVHSVHKFQREVRQLIKDFATKK